MMKIWRAFYSLTSPEGLVLADEQWVFFEADKVSEALEKISLLLTNLWGCRESQIELYNAYDESDLVLSSIDMDVDTPRDWRLFEVGYRSGSPCYLDVERDGYPLFLVSPPNLTRLNKALTECQNIGGANGSL